VLGVSMLASASLMMPVSGFSQEKAASDGAASAQGVAAAPSSAAGTETLKSVVRGLYADARVGGGYVIKDANVDPDPVYPNMKGSEALGAGSMLVVGVGYDLSDSIALEALGGSVLAAGNRGEKVRDLVFVFAAAGARLAFEIKPRLNFSISAGVGYVSADDGVAASRAGVAALLGAGIEYYVHVRHFSVGLDLLIPAFFTKSAATGEQQSRILVAVTPRLKYTF